MYHLNFLGAKIVLNSRKQSNVENAVRALQMEGIDCAGFAAHVGIDEDRRRLVEFAIERYAKLDILVVSNNAAVNTSYGDLMDVTDKQWDRLLNSNVRLFLSLVSLLDNNSF